MTRKPEQKQEIIDEVLDGEIGEELRQSLVSIIESDAGLKKEHDAAVSALRTIKAARRIDAPASFTRDVMRRLPAASPGLPERVREFLFRGRVLQWNMATAFGAVLIAALVFSAALRFGYAPDRALDSGQVVVTMNLYAPDARQVAVAGTFNKWNTGADVLKKGENGLWTISIPLQPGDYSYMFVVDGRAWVTDPNAESYRDDGFGNKNAVLRVKT